MKKKASESSLEQIKSITQKLAQIKNYHLIQNALNIARKVNKNFVILFLMNKGER